MTRQELREDLNEISRILLSAKYFELDFNYFNSVKYTQPLVYNAFYLLIERLYHSISVALILDLCKLFDKREKYSLVRLKNKMNENYEKSELNDQIIKSDFVDLFNTLDSDEIENLLIKLKTTRDKYYAHFDRKRTDFGEIQMNSKETSKLISIAESILKTIELNYFEKSVHFNLTIGELGHNIFERLNDWEEYRGKYGLLRNMR